MEIKYNYYRKPPPIFVFNNEKFKQYPLNSRYYIGENGTVYCIDGFLVTQFINRNGYAYCRINEKNEAIHRLVAITYAYNNNYKNFSVVKSNTVHKINLQGESVVLQGRKRFCTTTRLCKYQ